MRLVVYIGKPYRAAQPLLSNRETRAYSQARGTNQSDKLMELLPVILLANFVAMVITIIAAIKCASWSYRLIALVALVAFLFALYQFQAGSYQPASLVLSALLNFLIIIRVFANRRSFRRR